MLEFCKGDLLQAPVEALVNTVNTAGVMGKGVALQFSKAFEDNYKAYKAACKLGEVKVGKVFVFDRGAVGDGRARYILNFPTKKHWRNPSKIEYIEAGLQDLIKVVFDYGIKSIALPALGAGSGNLDWKEVRPLIEEAFEQLPSVRVMIFEPQPKQHHNLVASDKKPSLTPKNASILKLFALYGALGDTLGRLEAQKLVYFLQESGLDLKLKFQKNEFGPYADNLNHLLLRLEGHYIKGYGDRIGYSEMTIMPGTIDEIINYLADYDQEDEVTSKVTYLIEGFETPYGLELLSTVHWVMKYEEAHSFSDVVRAVRSWNQRKERFPERHIRVAWERMTNTKQPVA